VECPRILANPTPATVDRRKDLLDTLSYHFSTFKKKTNKSVICYTRRGDNFDKELEQAIPTGDDTFYTVLCLPFCFLSLPRDGCVEMSKKVAKICLYFFIRVSQMVGIKCQRFLEWGIHF